MVASPPFEAAYERKESLMGNAQGLALRGEVWDTRNGLVGTQEAKRPDNYV